MKGLPSEYPQDEAGATQYGLDVLGVLVGNEKHQLVILKDIKAKGAAPAISRKLDEWIGKLEKMAPVHESLYETLKVGEGTTIGNVMVVLKKIGREWTDDVKKEVDETIARMKKELDEGVGESSPL